MGAYINTSPSKELWLQNNAKQISKQDAVNHNDYNENLLVVLINNGFFTAAGIAFDKNEKKAFLDESDTRFKLYFTAKKQDLLVVSDLATWIK